MLKRILAVLIVLLWSGAAFAYHPLITDEADTPGQGKYNLELNGEYSHKADGGITTNTTTIGAILCYGTTEHTELILKVPYQNIRATEGENTVTNNGISDTEVELKWKFYEHEGMGLAVKPVIILPTGDYNKELGSGKVRYALNLITTKEIHGFGALHLNLGYERNENKLDERKDIWHASIASEIEAAEHLKAVVNFSIEKDPKQTSSADPATILGGIIYSATKAVDMDFAVKLGLNNSAPDYSLIAGVNWKF